MRSAVITFPMLMSGPSMSGVVPFDPRRMSADLLPRTRRCPPPIEDDSADTLFYLAWVLIFTLTAWQF
jgi:hypothetical protein